MMKRSLIVSLLVLMVVLVPVACNKSEEHVTDTTPSDQHRGTPERIGGSDRF
jgi:hypothetical protein